MPKGYDHKYTYTNLGYNLKMSDMQAAVGLAQIKKAQSFHKKRNNNFNLLYSKLIKFNKIFILPKASKKSKPSWFGFPLTIKKSVKFSREEIVKYLNNNSIGTRLLFAGNLIRQPYMKNCNYKVIGDLKSSNIIMERTFWVGLYPGLEKQNIIYIANKIENFLSLKGIL